MSNSGKFIWAGSKDCADMLYLTGFLAEDPFLWFSVAGQDYIIVSVMELERARKQCRQGLTVLTFEQAAKRWCLGKAKKTMSNLLAAIARKEKTWHWDVNTACPLEFVEKLFATRLSCNYRNEVYCSGDLFSIATTNELCPQRIRKTSVEANAIRHSMRIAEAGLARGIEMLSNSSIGNDGFLWLDGTQLTAEMLRGEINAEIARLNGTACGTICAPGLQSADPHQVGTGPVPANAPIVFDIFPRDDDSGYFGDLSRTVLKGKASAIVRKAFDAVYDAQRTAIDMLKPGISGKDVHLKAAAVMESYGFKTDLTAEKPCGFVHSLGHGVGLEIHEKPNLSPRRFATLEAGHVVTVEPGLYYPEWGGVRIEDTLLVTEDGHDDLATAEVFLEIE